MTERKEKTMLKWLKQKPTHGHGGLPIEKITDDPLATIQVHPHAKKSKNKANEIYAVSRVNPLFEEEDGKEVFSPGGNSGSSGYDSGSGPSDDDFPIITNSADLKDLQSNILGRLSSTLSAAHASSKHPQLFINTENDVIHHETAIVGPNGRPILQILEQNPNYVKSIALSVANGRKRPLSPISESSQQNPQPTTNTQTQIIRSSSTLSKFSPTPANLRDAKSNFSNQSNVVDSVGSAKLIKKDVQYVRSIRIGAPNGTGATKRSILEANRRFSSSSSSSSNTPSRRPSVTFADDVNGGSRPGSRKPSVEQDSIVTESLLMMTSVGGNDARRLSNASNSSSTPNSRKTSVSSAQSRSQDENSTETEPVSELDTVDLEAFADSLRKSRPIKQLTNNATRSQGSSDELDDTSSSSSNPTSEAYNSASPPPNERRATLDRPTATSPTPNTNPRIHTKNHKSAFGGIADHYAAAKEIAKEIESYSNGSAKASTKKSLVRDLLHRGSRNASNSTSTNDIINARTGTSASTSGATGFYGTNGKNGFRGGRSTPGQNGGAKDTRHAASTLQLHEQQVILAGRTSSPIYYESAYGTGSVTHGSNPNRGREINGSTPGAVTTTLRGGGSDDWELVRVQQVYVKAGSSSQDQQHQHYQQQLHQQRHHPHQQQYQQLMPKHKNSKEGDSSNIGDSSGKTAAHQGQEHSSTSATTSTNSRRHPSLSLSATPKTTLTTGGKAAKKVPKADDGLGAGARSRIQHDDDTDSGNSSDSRVWTYAEVRLEIEGTKVELSDDNVTEATSPEDENPDLPSKVMIVTGDSQNIVVDLSGVPLDLKNAIVSGTALITLPEGLDKLLQPGYTMITIPASRPMSPQTPIHTQLILDNIATPGNPAGGSPNNLSKKDGVMNITIGIDDDKPLVIGGSGTNPECKLYGTKNKAQIWDVLQNTLGKHEDSRGSEGGKQKKKITTIFPFHPNQDAYESPDFTIEGHRLDRQRKKVEVGKKRRCACRLCGILFFLVAFLGVLVALSMIYTKGQRYFGSV